MQIGRGACGEEHPTRPAQVEGGKAGCLTTRSPTALQPVCLWTARCAAHRAHTLAHSTQRDRFTPDLHLTPEGSAPGRPSLIESSDLLLVTPPHDCVGDGRQLSKAVCTWSELAPKSRQPDRRRAAAYSMPLGLLQSLTSAEPPPSGAGPNRDGLRGASGASRVDQAWR